MVGRARAYRLKIAEDRNSIAVRLDMLRTAEKDADTVLKNAPQNLDAVLEKGHVILDRGRLMAKTNYDDALTQYAAASKYFGAVIDKLKTREGALSKPEKILLAESCYGPLIPSCERSFSDKIRSSSRSFSGLFVFNSACSDCSSRFVFATV